MQVHKFKAKEAESGTKVEHSPAGCIQVISGRQTGQQGWWGSEQLLLHADEAASIRFYRDMGPATLHLLVCKRIWIFMKVLSLKIDF